MEENNDRIKTLFINLAKGKGTRDERLQIIQWLQNNPSPEQLPEVEELLAGNNLTVMPADTADAVFAVIAGHDARQPKRLFWKRPGIRVAAALVPLLGLTTILLLFRKMETPQVFVNNTRAVKTVLLDDGTTVQLNRNTTLKAIGLNGKGKRRELWLNGEAFFHVTHSATQPLTLHAGNLLDVNVLGTAFNVNTREGIANVVLNEGSVNVQVGTEKPLLLKPGEMAGFNSKTGILSKSYVDTLFQTSWKYNLMAFKAQPLKVVLQQLGEQYGYHIVFENKETEDLLFTGYLPADNLQQAVFMIDQSFNLKIYLHNQTIYVNKRIL